MLTCFILFFVHASSFIFQLCSQNYEQETTKTNRKGNENNRIVLQLKVTTTSENENKRGKTKTLF